MSQVDGRRALAAMVTSSLSSSLCSGYTFLHPHPAASHQTLRDEATYSTSATKPSSDGMSCGCCSAPTLPSSICNMESSTSDLWPLFRIHNSFLSTRVVSNASGSGAVILPSISILPEAETTVAIKGRGLPTSLAHTTVQY